MTTPTSHERVIAKKLGVTDAGLAQRGFLWLCAGVGFDVSQRVLDHFVDLLTDRYAVLAWLK